MEKFAKQNNALYFLIESNDCFSIEELFAGILSKVLRIEGSIQKIQKKGSSSNYQETSKSKKKEDEQAEDEQAETVQVIFLGEEKSGKKDIIKAYFDSHNSEFQNNIGSITIKVGNKFVKLLVISGGYYTTEFNKIIIQDSSAGVFVYNTNDKKTFVKLNDWFKAMDEIKPGAPKAIIGYLGSIENEEVTEEDLENLAKTNNIKYYQVVTIDNISDLDGLFINLAKEVLEQRQSANNGEKNKGNKKEGNGCCLIV